MLLHLIFYKPITVKVQSFNFSFHFNTKIFYPIISKKIERISIKQKFKNLAVEGAQVFGFHRNGIHFCLEHKTHGSTPYLSGNAATFFFILLLLILCIFNEYCLDDEHRKEFVVNFMSVLVNVFEASLKELSPPIGTAVCDLLGALTNGTGI